jgi:hypothetical protein
MALTKPTNNMVNLTPNVMQVGVSSSQTFTNNSTNIQITSFGSPNIDTNTSFASNTYTAKSTSIYELLFNLDFTGAISGLVFLKYQINSDTPIIIGAAIGLAQYQQFNPSVILSLNINDTLKFYFMFSTFIIF